MSDERHGAGTLFMVLAAFAGGIGLGMLLAPKSGTETRRYLGDQARKQSDAALRQARKVADDTAKRYIPLQDNDDDEWESIGKDLAKDLSRL